MEIPSQIYYRACLEKIPILEGLVALLFIYKVVPTLQFFFQSFAITAAISVTSLLQCFMHVETLQQVFYDVFDAFCMGNCSS